MLTINRTETSTQIVHSQNFIPDLCNTGAQIGIFLKSQQLYSLSLMVPKHMPAATTSASELFYSHARIYRSHLLLYAYLQALHTQPALSIEPYLNSRVLCQFVIKDDQQTISSILLSSLEAAEPSGSSYSILTRLGSVLWSARILDTESARLAHQLDIRRDM